MKNSCVFKRRLMAIWNDFYCCATKGLRRQRGQPTPAERISNGCTNTHMHVSIFVCVCVCVDVWLHLHTCLSLEAAGCHCIMRYAFGRYLKLVPNILLAYSCFCCFIVATLTFLVIRLFHLFSGKSCKTCWNARKIIVSMLEESIIRVCVQVFVCVSVYMMPKLW